VFNNLKKNAAMSRRPHVLVPACHRVLNDYPSLVVSRKYTDALRLAGCTPLVFPSIESADELEHLLDAADGVLLTGSPSNVHPSHFGEAVHNESLPLDPVRDAGTLALIPRVIARGIPLMAICRGFQEVNVALGGSLLQAVHEVEGHRDHRGAQDGEPAVVFAPAHQVDLVAGGFLATLLQRDSIEVNSVHGQGVNQLAPGLRVEAHAPDGLVEAFVVDGASGFTLAVQWHPEWQTHLNPVSTHIFEAFGAACRLYRDR
jgi:putative glutamine amidotransferase